MLIMALLMLIGVIISSVLIVAAYFVSKKTQSYREKMSPYECGFAPVKNSRAPFSLTFFLTTIIFLIFDVEVALLLPLAMVTKLMSTALTLALAALFTLILLAGLLHEWRLGALAWSK